MFVVYNPVDGSEELTARLSEEQKLRFQDAIKKFSDDAAKVADMPLKILQNPGDGINGQWVSK